MTSDAEVAELRAQLAAAQAEVKQAREAVRAAAGNPDWAKLYVYFDEHRDLLTKALADSTGELECELIALRARLEVAVESLARMKRQEQWTFDEAKKRYDEVKADAASMRDDHVAAHELLDKNGVPRLIGTKSPEYPATLAARISWFLRAWREATMLDNQEDATPEHLRQWIQDLADERDRWRAKALSRDA